MEVLYSVYNAPMVNKIRLC